MARFFRGRGKKIKIGSFKIILNFFEYAIIYKVRQRSRLHGDFGGACEESSREFMKISILRIISSVSATIFLALLLYMFFIPLLGIFA